MSDFVIAVDGPAASGKGPIATRLGALFGLPVLDTGLLYRAVGVLTERAGHDPDDAEAASAVAKLLTADQLDDPALRTRAAGELASRVAVHPRVREALFDFQRTFASQDGGAVLDGRDIGTVICPEAELKLYVVASDEVRAGRRAAELGADPAETLAALRERDARDSARATAPLRPADDAVILDTTHMTITEAVSRAIVEVQIRRR